MVSYIISGRQQSEKHDDGAADTTVAPEHQHSPSENDNRHAVDVTQMPSSAVVEDQNGVGGTKPEKHEVSSNNEYLDMSGAQPKNKIPRRPGFYPGKFTLGALRPHTSRGGNIFISEKCA